MTIYTEFGTEIVMKSTHQKVNIAIQPGKDHCAKKYAKKIGFKQSIINFSPLAVKKVPIS